VRLVADTRGLTTVEFVILVSLVAVLILAGWRMLGQTFADQAVQGQRTLASLPGLGGQGSSQGGTSSGGDLARAAAELDHPVEHGSEGGSDGSSEADRELAGSQRAEHAVYQPGRHGGALILAGGSGGAREQFHMEPDQVDDLREAFAEEGIDLPRGNEGTVEAEGVRVHYSYDPQTGALSVEVLESNVPFYSREGIMEDYIRPALEERGIRPSEGL
jgi:hypothetical protein